MSGSAKIDLFKLHKDEYVARKKPVIVTVQPARYLAIPGRGEPGGEEFQARVGALYAAAYTLKFTSKGEGRDYVVCKLEAIWWADGCDDPGSADRDFSQVPREQWRWQLMIRTPDFVEGAELSAAAENILAKGKCPEIVDVRLEEVGEGRCVQMLHVGPYEDEPETVAVMRAFAEEQGLAFAGRHHEIYLSDPRRVEPARLRTILRMPVR